jgi:hypothetical protein
MKAVISIIVLITSCQLTKVGKSMNERIYQTPEITISYSETDLYNGKIDLTIKNISDQPLIFSSPKCWSNSISYLKDKEGKQIESVKIKPDPKCLDEFISILPDGSYTVSYNYTLSEIYPQLNSGSYTLYFIYYGKIQDKYGETINFEQQIISSKRHIKINS